MATKAAKKKKADIKLDFEKVYGRDASDLDVSAQKFTLTAIRPDFRDRLDLGPFVESFGWEDGGGDGDAINLFPQLTGSMTLRRPADGSEPLILNQGHRVECRVTWFEHDEIVWTMRCGQPERTLDGGVSIQLEDDLVIVGENTGDFTYKVGKKKHTKGWLLHEIVEDIADRYRIPLGRITEGTRWIKDMDETEISPLEAIGTAVGSEVEYSGRRLVMRWANGALDIVPMRRNTLLYVLAEQLSGGTLTTIRRDDFCTDLTVRGSYKDGKKRKKINVKMSEDKRTKVFVAKGVARYGYVHKEVTFHKLGSENEALKRGRRSLARRMRHRRTVQLDHPGIAFLRRGDTVRISLPDEGYFGDRGIVFVTAASHTVAAGDYSMSLTLTFTDPQDPNDIRDEMDKAERLRKREDRAAKKDKDKDD